MLRMLKMAIALWPFYLILGAIVAFGWALSSKPPAKPTMNAKHGTPQEILKRCKIAVRLGELGDYNIELRKLPLDSSERKEADEYYIGFKKKDADANAKRQSKQDNLVRAIAGANSIKNAMRNPDSFELENATLMDNGSVCYKFRSQNGFGGMNRISAVLYGGENIKTSEMEGFSRKWNRECADKTGEDIFDYLKLALK